jgi:hypothetical protein
MCGKHVQTRANTGKRCEKHSEKSPKIFLKKIKNVKFDKKDVNVTVSTHTHTPTEKIRAKYGEQRRRSTVQTTNIRLKMDTHYMKAVKYGKYCGKTRDTQFRHTTHNA